MRIASGRLKARAAASAEVGEREFCDLKTRLEALDAASLLACPPDPKRSALAALLTVNAASDEETQALLRQLQRAGDDTLAQLDEVQTIARAMLFAHAREHKATSRLDADTWSDRVRRAWTLLSPAYARVRATQARLGRPELVAPPGSDSASHALAAMPAPSARVHARIDIELEVTLVSETNFYVGFTENLSEGGLFVATHKPWPIGSRPSMRLRLPDSGTPIEVLGQVRWLRAFSETSDVSPGMGVRFESLQDEDAVRIRAFIAHRAPIFFEE